MDKFERLTNYKRLLDQGVITQEEYEEIKSKLLKSSMEHEHLEKGARVVMSTFDTLRKKTDDVYSGLKEKGNEWIEKELEKERINEEKKKERKEIQRQEQQIAHKKGKDQVGRIAKAITWTVKRCVLCVIIVAIIIVAVTLGFYFSREKIAFEETRVESLHGLEFSVSDQFKKKESSKASENDEEVLSEKAEYDIVDSANRLIGTYCVEYLGEDVETEGIKEKICRSMEKESTNQIEHGVRIDGYYKKNNLTPRSVISDAVMSSRVVICTQDYSSFVISMKCNIWNYDAKTCDELFNSIKLSQYHNMNEAESLVVTYYGSNKLAYRPVHEDFKVEVNYKNGKHSSAEVFDVSGIKGLSEGDNKVLVECHGIKKVIHILSYEENESIDKDAITDDMNKDNSPFRSGDGLQA